MGPSDRAGVAATPRAGPERVGAREKALPEELGCGMRMEGAHRHEIKGGRVRMESAHRHERKLVECTLAKLGWGKGANEKKGMSRV